MRSFFILLCGGMNHAVGSQTQTTSQSPTRQSSSPTPSTTPSPVDNSDPGTYTSVELISLPTFVISVSVLFIVGIGFYWRADILRAIKGNALLYRGYDPI